MLPRQNASRMKLKFQWVSGVLMCARKTFLSHAPNSDTSISMIQKPSNFFDTSHCSSSNDPMSMGDTISCSSPSFYCSLIKKKKSNKWGLFEMTFCCPMFNLDVIDCSPSVGLHASSTIVLLPQDQSQVALCFFSHLA